MKYFGILIDPSKNEVTRVEMDNEVVGLSDLYSNIGCEMVERVSVGSAVVSVDDDDDVVVGKTYSIDLWIDEEGLLNGAGDRIGLFQIHQQVYCGRGLIILSDYEGEAIAFDSDNYDMSDFAEQIFDIVSNKNKFSYA